MSGSKGRNRRWVTVTMGVAALCGSVVVAQRPPGPRPGPPPSSLGVPMLMEVEPRPGDRPVLDAPFMAEAITTSAQVLADGNRIERRFGSKLARDSAGRLRSEQTVAMLGPMSLAGEPPRLVTISDPVAGVHWLLDEARQTAMRRRLAPPRGGGSGGPPRPTEAREGSRGGRGGPPKPPPQRGRSDSDAATAVTEMLGSREIAGSSAEGSRSTSTIAAGVMGNERPIHVVTERWVSIDLGIPLEIVRRDPRLGDTTYRVTSLLRGEPPAELFVIPEGYTVRDEPGRGGRPRGGR